MIVQASRQFVFKLAVAAPLVLSACAGADPNGGSETESVGKSQSAVLIGSSGHALDYIACAQEYGTCVVGGNRYMAYGSAGHYFYRTAGFPSGNTVPCSNAFFGGDPAPGLIKTCYVSNYAYQATEGASASASRNIAYGANGVFNFKAINGTYTCNNATFGDPIPGPTKACYTALPDYFVGAQEGGTLTSLSNTPIAYGANGNFLYRIASGSFGCNNSAFGSDPAPGISKSCYSLAVPFIADEGASVNQGQTFTYWYGSGLNGLFITGALPGNGICSNANFGGDPHVGATKHCY